MEGSGGGRLLEQSESCLGEPTGPNRIEFRALEASSWHFVKVKELNGLTNDFIFTSAMSTSALDNHNDIGRSLITLSPFRS